MALGLCLGPFHMESLLYLTYFTVPGVLRKLPTEHMAWFLLFPCLKPGSTVSAWIGWALKPICWSFHEIISFPPKLIHFFLPKSCLFYFIFFFLGGIFKSASIYSKWKMNFLIHLIMRHRDCLLCIWLAVSSFDTNA